jgi:hypothetical protein
LTDAAPIFVPGAIDCGGSAMNAPAEAAQPLGNVHDHGRGCEDLFTMSAHMVSRLVMPISMMTLLPCRSAWSIAAGEEVSGDGADYSLEGDPENARRSGGRAGAVPADALFRSGEKGRAAVY